MTETDELRGGQTTVLEGSDGWLFLATDDQVDVLDFYTNHDALAVWQYQQWVGVLNRRSAYFATAGVSYLTVVVPDSHVVYADKLPSGVELSVTTPYERLDALLDEKSRALYLREPLTKGRDAQDTYQSVDSHWTDWGAWLGYLETMHALAQELPHVRILAADELEWTSRQSFGALGATMTPERSAVLQVAGVRYPLARTVEDVMTEVREGYIVTEQDAPELPSAVIVRDSFMTAPAKFFSESFRRTTFVTTPNSVFYDLIDRESPDVVIHLMGERRLVYPPVEPSLTDFRSTFGDLLLGDRQAVDDQRKSRSLQRRGMMAEALGANDDALARVRPTARLMIHRGRLLTALGRLDAAAEALRHATSLDPSDGSGWFYLGEALSLNQRPGHALSAYVKATEVEPSQISFWPPAIALALELGNLDTAAELAERSSAAHPESHLLDHARSYVFAARDRLEEAAVASRCALAASPDTLEYKRQLASVLIRMCRWAEARLLLDEMLRVQPSDLVLLGYLHMVEEKLDVGLAGGLAGGLDAGPVGGPVDGLGGGLGGGDASSANSAAE